MTRANRDLDVGLVSLTSRLPLVRWGLLAGGAAAAVPPVVALTSALGPVLGLLGAVPSLAAAAGSGLAAAFLGLGGIGDALKAQWDGQASAAEDGASAAKSQRSAMEGVRSASETLADAHRTEGQVQRDLTEAREEAARELEDLRLRAAGAAISQKEAALALREAREELTATQTDPSATATERRQAELAVERALLGVREARAERRRADEEAREGVREGVRGSDRVVAARERLAEAERGVRRATHDVAAASAAASESMGELGGGADKVAEKMAQLSPAGQAFVNLMTNRFFPMARRLRATAQEGLLPGLGEGLVAASRNLPVLDRGLGRISRTLGTVARDWGRALGSRESGRDMGAILAQNERLLRRGGDASIHFGSGLRHVTIAAEPLVDWLGRITVRLGQNFEEWARAGRESGRLQEFFERVGPRVELATETLWDFGRALVNIGGAADRAWGGDLLRNLRDSAAALREWTGSRGGQREIEAFFERWERRWRAVGDAVGNFVRRYRQLRREGESASAALAVSLAEGFSRAIPKIVEETAERAPEIAAALVKGFLAANVWGKLLIGGWFLRKLGGGGAVTGIARSLAFNMADHFTTSFVGGAGRGGGRIRRTLSRLLGRSARSAAEVGASGAAETLIHETGTGVTRRGGRLRTSLRRLFSRLGLAAGEGGAATAAESLVHSTGVGVERRRPRLRRTLVGMFGALGILAGLAFAKQIGDQLVRAGPGWKRALGQILGGRKDEVPDFSRPGETSREALDILGLGGLFGRQRGGRVRPGEVTLVGERGPEIARFPAGTEIVPSGPSGQIVAETAGGLLGLVGVGRTAGKGAAEALTEGLDAGSAAARKAAERMRDDVGRSVEDMRRDAERGAERTRDALTEGMDDASKDVRRSAEDVRGRIDDMGDAATRRTRKMGDDFGKEYRAMRASSGRHVRAIASSTDDGLGRAQAAARRRGGRIRDAVAGSYESMDRAVHRGLAYVQRATSSALEGLGGKPVDLDVPRPRGLARGGFVEAPSRMDSALYMLGRDEAVLTGHHQERANAMLAAFGTSINDIILGDRRLHYAARGREGAGGAGEGGGEKLAAMMREARRMEAAAFGYSFGGAHSTPAPFSPWDCSSAVSRVVQAAYAVPTVATSSMESSWGGILAPGGGRVTVFLKHGGPGGGHTFMRLGQSYFGTSGENPGGGAGWFSGGGPAYQSGFRQYHLRDLGGGAAGFGAEHVPKIDVRGRGPLARIAQASINKVRGRANRRIDRAAEALNDPLGDIGDSGAPLRPGQYASTSYGPPWGGIQGTGVTATGVDLRGNPQVYGVAVDPSMIPLGARLRISPNPFGGSRTFRAFDTGGAIKGRRIDFYDWRGRAEQLGWGTRNVNVRRAQRGRPGLGGAFKAFRSRARGAGAGLKKFEDRITNLGELFNRREARYNVSEEDFIVEPGERGYDEAHAIATGRFEVDDEGRKVGLNYLDQGALSRRRRELKALEDIRRRIVMMYTRYMRAVQRIVDMYRRGEAKLERLMRAAGPRRNKKYRDDLEDVRRGLRQWGERHTDLGHRRYEARTDLMTIRGELRELGPGALADLDVPEVLEAGEAEVGEDAQAVIAQLQRKLEVATEAGRLAQAAVTTFTGPGDLGRGAASAWEAAGGGRLPGQFAAGGLTSDVAGRVVGPDGSPVSIGVRVQESEGAGLPPGLYLARVDDVAGKREVAGLATQGLGSQGYRQNPRRTVGL